jgi:Domain of unknown function (DUF4375)
MDKNKALIDYVDGNYSIYRRPYEDLSEVEKVFHSIWELEKEVNNGGFEQFFFNSSGEIAYRIVDDLKAIGATKAADISARTIAYVFKDIPLTRDTDERRKTISSLSEEQRDQLSEFDKEFFVYPDNLTNLLYSYSVTHKLPVPLDDGDT